MPKSLDDKSTLITHLERLKKNKFLRNLYTDFYNRLIAEARLAGPVVELGSGAGFLKQILPTIITSDVVGGQGIDKVFSATAIPFADNSIAAYLMYDVFHHIKDVETALREMLRTLLPGGKIIMIEPYNSIWGRFIYQNFHHEGFDPKNKTWFINGQGRLSDANGAMPWIVFERDRLLFEKKFPEFKIISVTPHTPFAYLLSGGLSKPQLLPGFCYPLVKFFGNFLRPFNRWLGMFATIVIKKN